MIAALILLTMPTQIYSSDPAFKTAEFEVYEYGATDSAEQINAAVQIAAQVFAEKQGFAPEPLVAALRAQNMDLYIRAVKYSDPGECPTKENPKRRCEGFVCELMPGLLIWCVGLYLPYRHRIDYVYRKCIGDSSLAHELVHAFEWLTTEETDPTHSNPALWPDACVLIENLETRRKCYRESSERLIQSALRKQFCSRGK